MRKINRKALIVFSLLISLSMYYLGIGIFFFVVSTAYFVLRLAAIIAPAVILAATLGVLVKRLILLKKG